MISPVFKCSEVVWFANGLGFEWHLITGHKSPVFEWLGCVINIIMLRIAILMYYHLQTGHLKVQYSDESGDQVFGLQMVTVFVSKLVSFVKKVNSLGQKYDCRIKRYIVGI